MKIWNPECSSFIDPLTSGARCNWTTELSSVKYPQEQFCHGFMSGEHGGLNHLQDEDRTDRVFQNVSKAKPFLVSIHQHFSNLVILHTYLPMKMEQSVPKRRHIKFRRRGITQKKAHKNILLVVSISNIYLRKYYNFFFFFYIRNLIP